MLEGRPKCIVDSRVVLQSCLWDFINLLYLCVGSLLRDGKKIVSIEALVFFLSEGCPFLAFILPTFFDILDESQHSIAFFKIGIELDSLQVELLCLLVLALIVEDVGKSQHNAIVFAVLPQPVLVPVLGFLIVLEPMVAKAEDVIGIVILLVVVLAPGGEECFIHSGPVLDIANSAYFVVQSWCSSKNILAKLDGFFELAL